MIEVYCAQSAAPTDSSGFYKGAGGGAAQGAMVGDGWRRALCQALAGHAATAQAAESSRHKPSSIDARSGQASQARTWGGPGGHGAHEMGRGERTVPEAGALVPSRPVR